MGENSVLSLFELTASVVSRSLDSFPRRWIEDLPVTILSALVEYLSAYHLDLYEDILQKQGINVSWPWIAHFKKRWSRSYQNRPPIFKTRDPPSYKHRYLQKHFHDCLQAILTGSAFDPSTPLRQPLRNEPTFLAKPMVKSHIEKDVNRYARYVNTLITRSTLCDGIVSEPDLLKILQKSTKVLETFVSSCFNNRTAVLGDFIKLFRTLQFNGCLEELHIHISSGKFDESLIQIVRGCAGQDLNCSRTHIKSRLPFLLGIPSLIKPEEAATGGNRLSMEGDLYDEALSTLESRKSEKEFQQLLEVTAQTVDNRSGLSSDSNSCTNPCTDDSSQGRQLIGLACYDIHCCGETARDLAYLFMAWEKLEKLAIHYFGGADMSMCEENDPDFALLCQVLLHKLREHRLTQLVLMEHVVHPGPLRAVVKFYTGLVTVLNKHYAILANEKRPIHYLRIPIICAMEDTALFGGRKINHPVRAVEDLRVDLDPAYPQNRDAAAQDMAAFISSFIQFDMALTALTIKDSAAYMFRASDEDIVTIASAVADNSRITMIELDINLTSQIAVEAVVNMIGGNQNLTCVTLKRVSVDWEQQQVKALQKKLIDVIKYHQSLTSLMLKGRLGRALNGTFLVDFVVKLFHGSSLPKLQQLDISETGITTDDLLRMMSELKYSPSARRFPALESLSVRNTVKSPNVSLGMLAKVKCQLNTLAYVVDVTFEERFGFQAELMAQV